MRLNSPKIYILINNIDTTYTTCCEGGGLGGGAPVTESNEQKQLQQNEKSLLATEGKKRVFGIDSLACVLLPSVFSQLRHHKVIQATITSCGRDSVQCIYTLKGGSAFDTKYIQANSFFLQSRVLYSADGKAPHANAAAHLLNA